MVGNRGRRNRLGFDGLRSRTGSAVHRRGQWSALEQAHPLTGGRRQSVPVVHCGDQARNRRVCLALPDHTRGGMGLHGHTAHHPDRSDHRWPATQGVDAGAQERFLLCHRSGNRQIHLGGQLCAGQLGRGYRSGDRPSDPDQQLLRALAQAAVALPIGRTQLDADVPESGYRLCLYPEPGNGHALRQRHGVRVHPGLLEYRDEGDEGRRVPGLD